MDYREFIESKKHSHNFNGIVIGKKELNPMLFEYQKDIIKIALEKKRYGVFLDTGLGKTFILCEYARMIVEKVVGRVLIICPLAVLYQTIREAEKLDIKIYNKRNGEHGEINIINYEKIADIDPDLYSAVILDESSILKSYSGHYKTLLCTMFNSVGYKLVLSATPSPNDSDEMGNQAEFLGIVKRREMLARYFINDLGDTGKWRLKKHAENDYFDFLSEWAVFITNPANLGYSNTHGLPSITIQECEIETENETEGYLFKVKAESLDETRANRKITLQKKADFIKSLTEKDDDFYIIWTFYNDESSLLHKMIPGSVEVTGSDEDEFKAAAINNFAQGKIRVLITKPKIAAFGINWQQCRNVIFFGTNNSYEQYYQAIRRCYRYGQKREVNVYLVYSDIETSVLKHIARKEEMNNRQKEEMEKRTKDGFLRKVKGQSEHKAHKIIIPKYMTTKQED